MVIYPLKIVIYPQKHVIYPLKIVIFHSFVTVYQRVFHGVKVITGWWLTYPSDKYEFVSWDYDIPN
jgi:hypothetical protein